jgi:hypothetical protein
MTVLTLVELAFQQAHETGNEIFLNKVQVASLEMQV